MSEFLIGRWCQALPADCGSAAAQAAGAELVARWSEPARRYHTVDHLAFMLTVLDEAAEFASDIHAVRLAAWFHDAVYDPHVA
ncbi:MAG TPA: metal-dependent phosphohydrolase, partial [Micromonosporaceae bacterium]